MIASIAGHLRNAKPLESAVSTEPLSHSNFLRIDLVVIPCNRSKNIKVLKVLSGYIVINFLSSKGYESWSMQRPCSRGLTMLRRPPENPLIAIVGATGTGKSQVSLPSAQARKPRSF